MARFASAFKGSAYIMGALTGAALMVPLTAAALGTGAMSRVTPHPVAIEAMGPSAPLRAQEVNRSAKGPRLDIAPAARTPTVTAGSTVVKTAPVVQNGSPTAATPTRAVRTPKGCLSAIGVTKSNLATEELTVCVADASVTRHYN